MFNREKLSIRTASEEATSYFNLIGFSIEASVTRFGEISPLGIIVKVFGKFSGVHLVFGKILNIF